MEFEMVDISASGPPDNNPSSKKQGKELELKGILDEKKRMQQNAKMRQKSKKTHGD